MRKLVFHLILIVFAIVSSGCTHSLDIRYNPGAIQTPNELSPEGTNIYLAPIEDIRSDKSSKDVNTGFQGRVHTYAPIEPPVDLTRKALTEKLKKYGINILESKEKAHGILKGILKDFSFSAGSYPDGAIISIDLGLFNSKETDLLWSQNLYGKVPVVILPYESMVTSGSAPARALSEALAKAVNSLDGFPGFIKIVSSLFANPNLNNRQLQQQAQAEKELTPQPPKPLVQQPSAKQQVVSGGTGFLFSSRDYIITNWHVVKGAGSIEVKFPDGEVIKAKVLAKDSQNDIAVLKLSQSPSTQIPDLNFGDSSKVRPGDKVFTIGYPASSILGKNQKITDGIVSSITGVEDDPTMFQITVPIQPGNSGGPLFNESGEVIGVTTASLSLNAIRSLGAVPQNVNYAIKSSFVNNLLTTIPKTLLSNRGIVVVPSKPGNSLADFFERVSNNIVLIEAKD